MSDADADPEVTELLADLTRSLQELQTEIEPDRRLRPPTLRELSQFTSEVAIPGLILILETNIRVLKLLQRTIRLAEGKDPTGNSTVPEMRDRAERLSRATLSQLESTLSEVQSAVEGRPNNDETDQLLSEARTLRDQIQDELERRSQQRDGADESATGGSEGHDGQSVDESEFEDDTVDIDVESELKSIKDNLEDVEDDSNGKRADDAAGSGDTQSDDQGDASDDTGSDAPDDSVDPDPGT
jgi:hypothetical protein